MPDSTNKIVWTEPAQPHARVAPRAWLTTVSQIVAWSLLGSVLIVLAGKRLAPQFDLFREGGRAVIGTFAAVLFTCLACAAITRLARVRGGHAVVSVSADRIVLNSSDDKRVFRLESVDAVILDARDPARAVMTIQRGQKSWRIRIDPAVNLDEVARLLGSRAQVLE